ncbi:hypothetical protein [Fluviispira sanaruensis]|uniref:Uncharacterized protein n=1 Tax=Fluviispira sanaruensis TaxID=2493639 RepID=A0A4V0P2X2_FLUSA|nr:hypothetical protein [Fluviispira sanaruensis]BBH54717.1 hypothetical protein JCM31447_31910 [Fluviispira sanaruensis]
MSENKSNKFILNLGYYSVIIQRYFWVVGVPYIIISPFIWGNYYKPPPPLPAQLMPVLVVDSVGNAKKIICDTKDEVELLPLAKKQVVQFASAMLSWPQEKSEASARIARFAKYFSQDRASQAQGFFNQQSAKILSESVHSQASFTITGMSADFDQSSNEFVVVFDGIQTVLKNEIKTSDKISVDIVLKLSSENRKKYEEVVLEIKSVNMRVKKNDSI